AKIPTFQDIPEAIEALSESIRLREMQARACATPTLQLPSELPTDVSQSITEWNAKQLLQSQDGISIPKSVLLGPGETVTALPFPPPLVAKIQSTQLLHKSDAGGVILKIDTPETLNSAIGALESKARELNLNIQGILV